MSPHNRQATFMALNASPTLSSRWLDKIQPDGEEWSTTASYSVGAYGRVVNCSNYVVANTKQKK